MAAPKTDSPKFDLILDSLDTQDATPLTFAVKGKTGAPKRFTSMDLGDMDWQEVLSIGDMFGRGDMEQGLRAYLGEKQFAEFKAAKVPFREFMRLTLTINKRLESLLGDQGEDNASDGS